MQRSRWGDRIGTPHRTRTQRAGPITLTLGAPYGSRRNEICEALIRACNDLGFPFNADFNGATQDGVGYHQTTTRNGRRCSTAVGYLKPATRPRNLRVVAGALAERSVFQGRRAVGMAFRQDGFSVTARARREVSLCGGAINSPQLLLLSGVGPQQHLTDPGVPVVPHLPGVGQAMQDHYSAPTKLKCRYPITVNDIMLSPAKMLRTGLDYYLRRRGATAAISSQVALFARTRAELVTPDIKMSISIFRADRPQDGLHRFSGFTLIVCQLRPESRGEIRLKSPRPGEAPAIFPNYLAIETDRRTIIDGLLLGRRLLATPHLQHYVAEEFLPGPQAQTDAQILEHARNRGGTVFHPTSTCKMGIDTMAVVDPELRVQGIGGLRVVDASVMPTVVSGNTNAATIMDGEKATDLVRRQMRMAA